MISFAYLAATSAVALSFFAYYLTFCWFTTHFYEMSNAPFFGLAIAIILWRDASRPWEDDPATGLSPRFAQGER